MKQKILTLFKFFTLGISVLGDEVFIAASNEELALRIFRINHPDKQISSISNMGEIWVQDTKGTKSAEDFL